MGLNFYSIDSIDVNKISTSDKLSEEILTKSKKMRLKFFSVIFLFLPEPSIGFAIFVISAIALTIVDNKRKSIKIQYNLNNDQNKVIADFYDSVRTLSLCKSAWHIPEQADNADSKYHAGANSIIKRNKINIKFKKPKYIKTNIIPPVIPVGKQKIYFLPDRLIIEDKKYMNSVPYKDLVITVIGVRFVESGPVPKDSTIVDHTWQYVNKSGAPDKRFKDNKKFPIALYGAIVIKSASGVNEEIHISTYDIARSFVEHFNLYKEILNNIAV